MIEDTSIYAKCNGDTPKGEPTMIPHPAGSESHCRTDECGCHHPLRLWGIKYTVVGVPKYKGVAVVQAKDLCSAEMVFIQDSKFNGFREYIKINCIEEIYPDPAPCILMEDSASIVDKQILKSYPFTLKDEFQKTVTDIYKNITVMEDSKQVNADWNETDETSKAYILNKPTIPVVDLTKAKADVLYQPKGNYALTEDLFSGSYNDLTDKPSLFSGNYNDLTGRPTLFSGSYNDLSDKPTIPEEQVNADWESESGKSQILNKPTDLVRTSDIEGLLRNDGTVYTGKYLEQVEDLDNFQASEGKIVQYIGETNSKYTNSFNYKKVETQTVIPAGTDFINIKSSGGYGLSKCGITQGIYYKTDKTDAISGNIMKASPWSYAQKIGGVNVYPDGADFKVRVGSIGVYWISGSENRYQLRQVETVYYKTTSQGISYPYRIILENGLYDDLQAYYNKPIVPSYYLQSEITIFESLDGKKIYCYESNGQYYVLPLDFDGEHYQAIPDALFINSNNYYYTYGTTQESIDIDTTEWQQCLPPEEDTSHYVLDSDIGWIEH